MPPPDKKDDGQEMPLTKRARIETTKENHFTEMRKVQAQQQRILTYITASDMNHIMNANLNVCRGSSMMYSTSLASSVLNETLRNEKYFENNGFGYLYEPMTHDTVHEYLSGTKELRARQFESDLTAIEAKYMKMNLESSSNDHDSPNINLAVRSPVSNEIVNNEQYFENNNYGYQYEQTTLQYPDQSVGNNQSQIVGPNNHSWSSDVQKALPPGHTVSYVSSADAALANSYFSLKHQNANVSSSSFLSLEFERVVLEWSRWEYRYEKIEDIDLTIFLFNPDGQREVPQTVRFPVGVFNLFKIHYSHLYITARSLQEAYRNFTTSGNYVPWKQKCDQIINWQNYQIKRGWVIAKKVKPTKKSYK